MKQALKTAKSRTKVLFVINPKSGSAQDDTLKDLISEQAETQNFDFQIYNMTGNDEARISTEIKRFRPSIVAAAGGDGTVKMVAGILANTKITLAIIPYGSANGMAKELYISDIDFALELLSAGKVKPIDLININKEICIHLADVGLNARVVKRFEKDPKRGKLIYAKHLFGEMFFLKSYRFQIKHDDEEISRKGVSITFANAMRYGTGAIINPHGILDDGKFELVIVKPFPRVQLMSIAWKMFRGKLHTSDYVEIISCEEATIISSRKTTLQVDGEVIGKVKEIKLSIMPKALSVLVPKDFKTEAVRKP
ncbi:diacylglycerol/lipid kinase family protein [Daejeonella lutea]|uniref:Lipid kinase, YegS/Rv2252/BmrU family n=1 Tax=Daejeonella lutea TaxID=572036 RepID=A0A1T5B588_9SPHI|nr:diacylglycerol kinase family protein [Daejeonella lutea]SKB42130.1 lipid kinase, YegS/Rv2252/BmrU family [Daejeonella lutea]